MFKISAKTIGKFCKSYSAILSWGGFVVGVVGSNVVSSFSPSVGGILSIFGYLTTVIAGTVNIGVTCLYSGNDTGKLQLKKDDAIHNLALERVYNEHIYLISVNENIGPNIYLNTINEFPTLIKHGEKIYIVYGKNSRNEFIYKELNPENIKQIEFPSINSQKRKLLDLSAIESGSTVYNEIRLNKDQLSEIALHSRVNREIRRYKFLINLGGGIGIVAVLLLGASYIVPSGIIVFFPVSSTSAAKLVIQLLGNGVTAIGLLNTTVGPLLKWACLKPLLRELGKYKSQIGNEIKKHEEVNQKAITFHEELQERLENDSEKSKYFKEHKQEIINNIRVKTYDELSCEQLKLLLSHHNYLFLEKKQVVLSLLGDKYSFIKEINHDKFKIIIEKLISNNYTDILGNLEKINNTIAIKKIENAYFFDINDDFVMSLLKEGEKEEIKDVNNQTTIIKKLSDNSEEEIKEINNINQSDSLTNLNALGNDQNLSQNGGDAYWYSIGDGFKLIMGLRKKKLTYTDETKNIFYKPKVVGEEYSYNRQNKQSIYISDPCHIAQLENSFQGDMRVITGNYFENEVNKNNPWTNMPQTLIIPLLSGLHWTSIRIQINYEKQLIDVLYDDPYGLNGGEKEKLKNILMLLTAGIELLFKKVNKLTTFTLQEENILKRYKSIDQQGKGKNGCDCGPITFSNINDYTNFGISNEQFVNSVFENNSYTISAASFSGHKDQIKKIRKKDIKLCQKIADINASEEQKNKQIQLNDQVKSSAGNKLLEIKEQIKNNNLLTEEISKLEPYTVMLIFALIESKRLSKNEKIDALYTEQEIQDSYNEAVLTKKNSQNKEDKKINFNSTNYGANWTNLNTNTQFQCSNTSNKKRGEKSAQHFKSFSF